MECHAILQTTERLRGYRQLMSSDDVMQGCCNAQRLTNIVQAAAVRNHAGITSAVTTESARAHNK